MPVTGKNYLPVFCNVIWSIDRYDFKLKSKFSNVETGMNNEHTDPASSLCEERVFSRLFHEHLQSVYRTIFYRCGNTALSEDLAQEAFTRLWQRCAEVQPPKALAYVMRTATNLLLNHFQHQKVIFQHQNLPRSEPQVESPQFALETKEFEDRLASAIAALPEKQRVVFLLSRVDKKTYKEIANLLEISRQAVEKRIYNALQTLRREVSEKIR